jgi:hypothetical protein
MSDASIKNARDAEAQIASIVIKRGIEGKDSWKSSDNTFYALIEGDLSAGLAVDSKSVARAERWDVFTVQQGEKRLVLYYYPTAYREATSQNLAPAAIQGEIDKLFQHLLKRELDSTYGPALERLRSLK